MIYVFVCMLISFFSLIINAIPLNYFILMLKFRFIILQKFRLSFLFSLWNDGGVGEETYKWSLKKHKRYFERGGISNRMERKKNGFDHVHQMEIMYKNALFDFYEQTEEWEKKNHHRYKFWECFFGVHQITYLSFTMLFFIQFRKFLFFWQLKQINSRFLVFFSRFFFVGVF